jgi:hypothetical protein
VIDVTAIVVAVTLIVIDVTAIVVAVTLTVIAVTFIPVALPGEVSDVGRSRMRR